MTNHKSGLTVAIIGATGNVGRNIVSLILEKKLLAPSQLRLSASKKSTGKTLSIQNTEFKIEDTDTLSFKDTTICIFATESHVSKSYIPKALDENNYVIDSSSLYRLDTNVPLVVAPVNKKLISTASHHLYAIANCVASPMTVAIAPLHRAFEVKRVTASTYQSTSGAGKDAMDELREDTKCQLENKVFKPNCFQRNIAFNVIPQVDRFMDDGFTYEEYKICHEVQKIIPGDYAITATSVRVPVLIGHSISLSIEFKREAPLDKVLNTLQQAANVVVSANHYATPKEVVGSDDVFVGRLRKDPTVAHGVQLWICSDNLRRGAATDAVEVLEELIKQIQ